MGLKQGYMETKRTTPERITTLQPGEIFVFGSNLEGMHGGGAAYLAYRQFGAIMGQGVGLQGQSYGIPTMQGGVETIRPYVDEFVLFAKAHPELTYPMTVDAAFEEACKEREPGHKPDVIIPLPYPEQLTDNIDPWVLWVAKKMKK